MRRSFRVLAMLAALMLPLGPAAAELMIAPTRVVLDPAERSTELVLVNRGTEAAAFRLSIENRRMRRDGSMEAADPAKPGELFAADMIRFAPRRVVLDAGARQTVRLTADLPAGLAPGEYRSHLRLSSAPVSAGRTLESATATNDNQLSIELVAVRSITIPVIVRVGALDAKVAIGGAALKAAPEPVLALRMTRTGTRSTFGDVRLFTGGAREPVYQVRGVAIYTPNADREVLVALPADVRAKIAGQAVRIDYVSTDAKAPGLIATASVQL